MAKTQEELILSCSDFLIENIDYVRPWEKSSTSISRFNNQIRQTDVKYTVEDLDTQLYIITNYLDQPTDFIDGYWRFYLKSDDYTIISYIKFGTDCSEAEGSFSGGYGIPPAEFTYADVFTTGDFTINLPDNYYFAEEGSAKCREYTFAVMGFSFRDDTPVGNADSSDSTIKFLGQSTNILLAKTATYADGILSI